MCATHVFAIFSAVHDQKMKILVAADSWHCPEGHILMWLYCRMRALAPRWLRSAFLSKKICARLTFEPFAAIPMVTECWLRCLQIALIVLKTIWLHNFPVKWQWYQLESLKVDESRRATCLFMFRLIKSAVSEIPPGDFDIRWILTQGFWKTQKKWKKWILPSSNQLICENVNKRKQTPQRLLVSKNWNTY